MKMDEYQFGVVSAWMRSMPKEGLDLFREGLQYAVNTKTTKEFIEKLPEGAGLALVFFAMIGFDETVAAGALFEPENN
jgi:hypothetical protein